MTIAMAARAALVLAVVARACHGAVLPSSFQLPTPGPYRRWFAYSSSNPCSTAGGQTLQDTGSAPVKMPLTWSGSTAAGNCDSTNQAFTGIAPFTSAAPRSLVDDARYMSVVMTFQATGANTGTAPNSFTYTPLNTPAAVLALNARNAGSNGLPVELLTPWTAISQFFDTFKLPATLLPAGNYMYVVTIGPSGARTYVNGMTLMRASSTNFGGVALNQNAGPVQYGVNAAFPTGNGNLLIASKAALAIQDVQVYNYELSKAQVKALVAAVSVVLPPPPPPATIGNGRMASDPSLSYNAVTSLLAHRYLGPNPLAFADGTATDWVGANDGVFSGSLGFIPNTGSNILSIQTVSGVWGCVEVGLVPFTAAQNSFTVRMLFSSDVGVTMAFQILYNNYFIQFNEVGGSASGILTALNQATGVQVERVVPVTRLQKSATTLLSSAASGWALGYVTVSAGPAGVQMYIGAMLVASFPTVLPAAYNSDRSSPGMFCFSAGTITYTSAIGLADIQVYDTALTPATIIALGQGQPVTSML